MQTRSPIFDDLAQLLTSAAGAAKGVREEMETLVRVQVEKAADRLDLVPREDFEAVRAMAVKASDRVEALEVEVASLKKELKGAPPRKTSAKKAARPKAKTKAKRKSSGKTTR